VTSGGGHHLAQVNVARLREPLDSPQLTDFVAALEPINAIADRMDAYLALWWVPAGTIPAVADASRRLALLASQGPTQEAFTFRVWYPPPGATSRPAAGTDERYRCTAT
jgi:Domain of unknown function (DUF3291)